MQLQEEVRRHETEVRYEAQLVRQVAEASLIMSEALSSAGRARDVATRVKEARSRASHNLSCAKENRKLAAGKVKDGQRLQQRAVELSMEAKKLQACPLILARSSLQEWAGVLACSFVFSPTERLRVLAALCCLDHYLARQKPV